jgi:hypothetical protein
MNNTIQRHRRNWHQAAQDIREKVAFEGNADVARSGRLGRFFQPQHPPSGPPAISLRFAEPPSVEGTGGGQIGEGGLGAVAVVLAAWVEVSESSPGNSKGD